MNQPLLVAVLLWAVTLWRLPALRHSHKQRALAATFGALAASMTFDIPAVKQALDATVGVNDLAPLLKHVLGVASAATLLDFVIAVVRPEGLARRFRLTAIVTALPLMVVFYALANWVPGARSTHAGPYSLYAVLYMAVFTLYIGTAMVVATWLFLSGTRHSRSAWGRAGLVLLGTGTGLGSLYALQRIAFIALNVLTDVRHPVLEDRLSTTLKLLAIISIALGSCLPPISVAVNTMRSWKSLRDLEPLWRGLTQGVPHVILQTKIPRRRVSLRLERRIIEIEDACLALREYVPSTLQERARTAVARAGVPGPQQESTAEAAWLHAAASLAPHNAPQADGPHPTPGGIDKDPSAELTWLRQVSHAYRTSPLVTTFTAQPQPPMLLPTDDPGMFLHDR